MNPPQKIPLTTIDRVLEALCILLLAGCWTAILVGYSRLPASIPSHFNAAGEADDYSAKASIFMLPVIATAVYLGMTFLNTRPHLFNLGKTVTAETAAGAYRSAAALMRLMKLGVIVVFALLIFITFRAALFPSAPAAGWLLPVCLSIVLIPTIIYLVPILKQKP